MRIKNRMLKKILEKLKFSRGFEKVEVAKYHNYSGGIMDQISGILKVCFQVQVSCCAQGGFSRWTVEKESFCGCCGSLLWVCGKANQRWI
jgi:hypothetical protein